MRVRVRVRVRVRARVRGRGGGRGRGRVRVHHVEAHLSVLGCQRPPRNGGVLCAAGLAQLVEHLGVREPLLRRDHRAVVRRQRRDQRAHQLMLLRASLATRLGLHLRAARPSL